ncbi:MAG: hypothetical protein KIT66_05020 [Chitinophagaceae bacterium]|nr:hypothetical protein [Chitinophagaceae bacterium]
MDKKQSETLMGRLIILPLQKISVVLENIVDNKILDGFVNGIGRGMEYAGRQVRYLQSGQLSSYFLIMVLCLIIFLAVQIGLV